MIKLCRSFRFLNYNGVKIPRRYFSSPTVFALSSGQGKCAVAVIRVTGPAASVALQRITTFLELPKPRTAILRSIKHPITKEILDKGLIIWFPGPRSYTGEDSFELQVHGGIAVVNAILNALGSMSDLRLAEPGEFTRRAFHNAKLDLTEVEGLADLLQAETELQRKQAFLQSQGALSRIYNNWKEELINCVAHVEAIIDFEEIDTLDMGMINGVIQKVEDLVQDIEKHLADGRKGEILRHGVKTVILGKPNVGKSSLLNILCQRPVAIVTPIAGTTRDVVEVTINIKGYPLVLADTAGLRTVIDDVIEKEGISRALELYHKSDLVIIVIDFEEFIKWRSTDQTKIFRNYVGQYISSLNLNLIDETSNNFTKPCIIVLNKIDLGLHDISIDMENVVGVSCKTQVGIKSLVESIANQLSILCGNPTEEHPSSNQIRHRQHLNNCVHNMRLFLKESSNDELYDLVLMSEYLRKSLRHLGKLVGNVTTDDLLDVIFKDFCIGK